MKIAKRRYRQRHLENKGHWIDCLNKLDRCSEQDRLISYIHLRYTEFNIRNRSETSKGDKKEGQ